VWGAPVKRSRRGGFDLRIPTAEREVLGAIPDMLRALLVDGDAADPALQRLYPKAFTDDEDASAEFHDITHDELLEQRLAAIDTRWSGPCDPTTSPRTSCSRGSPP